MDNNSGAFSELVGSSRVWVITKVTQGFFSNSFSNLTGKDHIVFSIRRLTLKVNRLILLNAFIFKVSTKLQDVIDFEVSKVLGKESIETGKTLDLLINQL